MSEGDDVAEGPEGGRDGRGSVTSSSGVDLREGLETRGPVRVSSVNRLQPRASSNTFQVWNRSLFPHVFLRIRGFRDLSLSRPKVRTKTA